MSTMVLAQARPEAIGAALAAMLCTLVIFVLVGTLIGAIILRAAIWLYNKMAGGPGTATAVPEPGFGMAMLIAFVSMVVNAICNFAAGMLLGLAGAAAQADPRGFQALAMLISLPIGILVLAGMTSAMLPCSFGKGIVIALLYLLIALAVAICIAVVVAIVMVLLLQR